MNYVRCTGDTGQFIVRNPRVYWLVDPDPDRQILAQESPSAILCTTPLATRGRRVDKAIFERKKVAHLERHSERVVFKPPVGLSWAIPPQRRKQKPPNQAVLKSLW